jgi:hypothetical protein
MPAPQAHDKYKGIREGGVVAILQTPGEKPVQVDLKKGYSPAEPNPKPNENTPHDQNR